MYFGPEPAGPSMYARVGGRRIYYKSLGEGTPVVAIHGFGIEHHVMLRSHEPVLGRREGYRRIYFDLPGMGRSQGGLPRDSDEMLELVLGFIDSVIPGQRFLLTGASYGAYLARAVARRWPDRVLGLMLPVPMIVPERGRRDLPQRLVVKRDEAFLSTLAKEEREELESTATVLDEGVWRRYREGIIPGTADRDGLARFQSTGYALSLDVDLPGRPFPAPALLVMGRQDTVVGYADALRVIESFPRGTIAVLDRASHALEMEQPGIFGALMGEWLDRVEEWAAREGPAPS